MPGINYRQVRERISMNDVLQLASLPALRPEGVELRGPCPFHGSEEPRSRSFAVNVRKNAYHCFKCGAAGNQIDFWAALTNQSLHEAAADLCRRCNVDIPWIHRW